MGKPARTCGQERGPFLAEWPLPEPADWLEQVNLPQTESELEAIYTLRGLK